MANLSAYIACYNFQQLLTRLCFFSCRLLCWHSGRNSVVSDADYK